MAFLVALAVALVATPLARLVALRLDVVDRPGAHKVQAAPVPYLGGVAVFVAITAAILTTAPRLLLPLGLAAALGVADDLHERSPILRVAGAVVVGAAAGWAAPFPIALGGVVTGVITVGLLNAVNLLDGLDGLAAGVALASAVGFATEAGDTRVVALALAGGLAGFLAFNRPPARIYLGDGGAYLVGTALALLAALLVDARGSVAAAWAAVPLLLAVPALDTAVTIVRRLRARRPLFGGDRAHVYDQVVDRGHSPVTATLALVAVQAALATAAVGVLRLDAVWALTACFATGAILAAATLVGGFASPSQATEAS